MVALASTFHPVLGALFYIWAQPLPTSVSVGSSAAGHIFAGYFFKFGELLSLSLFIWPSWPSSPPGSLALLALWPSGPLTLWHSWPSGPPGPPGPLALWPSGPPGPPGPLALLALLALWPS
jgi:hypothetical protein